MEELPLNKIQAFDLLKNFNNEKSSMNHYIESAAIMKALAKHFGEDENYWEMIGLLHDIDWAQTKNNIKRHCIDCVDILKDKGFNNEFIRTIQSHGYGLEIIPELKNKIRNSKIEYSLVASETLTGLIYAYALMRDGKVSDMEVKGLKKKFKNKNFATTCDRNLIMEIEKTGLDIEMFFELSINAIKEIRNEIGLK